MALQDNRLCPPQIPKVHPQAARARVEAEQEYTRMVDERAADTPWLTGGCRSWYVDERSRRLTLVWPGTVADYRAVLAAADGWELEIAGTLVRHAGGRVSLAG